MNSRIFTSLMSKKSMLGALVISVSIFLWSLWLRPITGDEPWLAEYSFWLYKLGYVKSDLMLGFMDVEHKLYAYHKLFNIQGSWIIGLFGLSPYILKCISLLYLALSVPVLIKIHRMYSESKTSMILFFALYLGFFHTMELGFTFRPEVSVTFWGLLSYLFLEFYFRYSKKSSLIWAGLFSAIAVATHLNGMVIIGAGVLLLWFHKKWREGFLLGTLGGLGLLFYFLFDARSSAEIMTSIAQLRNWRDVATASYHWSAYIFRLINEQERFLHSPPELAYTLLLLMTLIPGRKVIKTEMPRLILYAFLITLCLALISHGKTAKYLAYASPFFLLASTFAIEKRVKEAKMIVPFFAILIFLMVSWGYEFQRYSSRETMTNEYLKVAQVIPEGTKVLAPIFYAYYGLGKQRIQSFVNYRDAVETGKISATSDDLLKMAADFDNDYVILNKQEIDFFNVGAIKNSHYRESHLQPSSSLILLEKIQNP